MAAVNWEVTFFEITTTRSDRITDTLYANGRMQVPIDVSIKAVVNDETYTLSEQELASIKLVRYVSPDEDLPDGWDYTASENEFDHVMPTTVTNIKNNRDSDIPAPAEALHITPRADHQVKRYWVSTTHVENEQIAASILSPSGEIITTHEEESGFDSYVALTGVAPITYHKDDLVTDKYSNKDDVEKHEWSFSYEGLPLARGTCYQQNVYVSLKNERMLKSEVTGVKRGDSEFWFNHAYRRHVPSWVDHGVDIHYIWDTGDPEQQWVGQPLPWDEFDIDTKWEVETNKKSNKLNLARCAIRTDFTMVKLWNSDYNWDQENSIILYDRCGNTGQFKAKPDNDWDTGGSRLVED
ncbi:hypothetical protein BO94DRAFT_590404 [Aspergillus sclerotioniger CBS 115572]|uniref:Uncharacterized protein n=1 Tax=Aspergillus sclerotioniger CBS 115572 TaxID=1450535 RepID=A0A317V8B0_9EURO|nr:hypothetical protein BO94DRAFT_590404 [Aspergillus sclerotioniger CBS 115572]PWY69619.1 hypothetical protein BO94DRAFT_590404 [Aspergillus sclerotioniger CBS 115572]